MESNSQDTVECRTLVHPSVLSSLFVMPLRLEQPFLVHVNVFRAPELAELTLFVSPASSLFSSAQLLFE
jgi:hypothetical protein